MEVEVAAQDPDALEHSEAAAVERHSRELLVLTIRAMEAADVDLRPSGLRALLVLDDFGPCTLGELAERLALSQSATSRMVDKLVVRKLINRRTATSDRRQVALTPTSAGRRTTARLVQRRREAIAAIMSAMDGGSREQLGAGLEAFADAARGARTIGADVG
jgi:DNA-binding MarR family transcriptional regulator